MLSVPPRRKSNLATPTVTKSMLAKLLLALDIPVVTMATTIPRLVNTMVVTIILLTIMVMEEEGMTSILRIEEGADVAPTAAMIATIAAAEAMSMDVVAVPLLA